MQRGLGQETEPLARRARPLEVIEQRLAIEVAQLAHALLKLCQSTTDGSSSSRLPAPNHKHIARVLTSNHEAMAEGHGHGFPNPLTPLLSHPLQLLHTHLD